MIHSPLRIALMNDYEIVLAGIREMLAPHRDRVEVVEFDVNETQVKNQVDIVLYDTYGQDTAALVQVRDALNSQRVGKVVLFSWNFDAKLVEAARAAGVSGVLAKSLTSDQLVAALESIAHGTPLVSPQPLRPRDLKPEERRSNDWPGRTAGLTMREAEMVSLISQGLSNAEIASRTYLSPNSVKSYIRSAYRKIGVQRRSQAVAWGIDNGLVPDRGRNYA